MAFVTLADSHRGRDGTARPDAIMLAAWLAARSTRIGIVAAAETTTSEPFLLATQIATIDFVSQGRAGWLAWVSDAVDDGGYVGPRPVSAGAEAWTEAREYLTVVRQLWDSWEDDAEIRDIPGQRFIDRDRIHPITFTGEHLSIHGPSITPRSPQGQPPIVIAAQSPAADELAAAEADVICLEPGRSDPDALRQAAEHRGREVRVLADLAVASASPDRLRELDQAGFDGVRLITSGSPGDLAAVTALAAERPAEPAAGATSATLRDALGLARPTNRNATPAVTGPTDRSNRAPA